MDRLIEILERTGLPVAYHHFNSPPTLPFIVFLIDSTNNLSADNKVYKKIDNYRVELYTEYKELEVEEMLEDILDSEGIFYNKNENYIEEEKMYQLSYRVNLGGS